MNPSAHPQRLGPYQVTGVLGSGGVGAIYLGKHPTLGYEVAIKVLLLGARADERQLRRFEREADALGKLRHPGLVDVVDRGRERGLPWLAMRRIPGENLAERLSERGTMSEGAALDLGLQLAAALSAAHAVGVIHRDLKPENVLCTPEGSYVLTDFGLAKDLEVEHSVELSKTGVSLGTPGYWAPEQALGDETSIATDVYGWGATIYAAVTGAPPIEAESFLEAVVATKTATPKSFGQHGVSAPRLEGIVRRCLAKDPDERFPDLASLSDALEVAAAGGGRRLSPGILALLGAALLGGGALSAGLLLRGSEPGREAAPSVSPVDAVAGELGASPELDLATPTPEPRPKVGAELGALTPAELGAQGRALLQAGRFQEAALRLEEAWAGGDVGSALPLAELYLRGQGVAIDLDRGRSLLKKAGERGHAGAMIALGRSLSARFPQQARTWLEAALRAGERKEAYLALGDLLRLSGRGPEAREEALRCYRQAAQAGAVREASYGQALLHLQGESREQALAALQRLAEADYWPAVAHFGASLASGQDPATAAQGIALLERGAAAGDPPCARELGLVYLRGGEGSRGSARRWLEVAAKGGDAAAMLSLAGIRGDDEEAAKRWVEAAAALEDPRAEATLGRLALGRKDYAEARVWFERAGEAAEPKSLGFLAELYAQGLGVKSDLVRSDRYLEAAAEAGDATSQHNLAVQHELGTRRGKDLARAEALYMQAGAQGLGVASYAAARLLTQREELGQAAEWHQRGARQGNASSMLALGNALVAGKGVERDLELGLTWFKRSADAGSASGAHMAAMMFERGLGTSLDLAAAADYYRRGAEAGDLASMLALGEFLAEGKGLAADATQAEAWYAKALEGSDPPGVALYERGYAYARGSGLPRDPARAVELYRRAAEAGHTEAAFQYALHLSRGRGVAADLPRAHAIFAAQAEAGRAAAMLELARLLGLGLGVERDVAAARRWINEAVEREPKLARTAESLLAELIKALESELEGQTERQRQLEEERRRAGAGGGSR